jgi:hypothetical protein
MAVEFLSQCPGIVEQFPRKRVRTGTAILIKYLVNFGDIYILQIRI